MGRGAVAAAMRMQAAAERCGDFMGFGESMTKRDP
jgi:hypothetical protein